MKYLFLLISVLVFTSASAQKKPAKKNYVTSLKNYQENDTLFKSKKGNLFQLTFVPDSEMHAEALVVNCNINTFSGTDRKKCKISIATAAVQTKSFTAFIAALPSDDAMMANPNITRAATNPRVAEENHNISLTNIFLFALKRESDNDYHLIVGNKNHVFFNVEISGLPPKTSASFQKLSSARAAVDAFFGGARCNTGGYNLFAQGIKIQLTGSTFYDIDHPPGTVGPAGFRPNTAWEIHPITDIKFLQ